MKKFLEEYGFGILVAIVVIILIGISTPVGNIVKESVSSVVSSLGVRTDSRLAAVQGGDLNVLLRQEGDQLVIDVLSESTTDVFAIEIKEVYGQHDEWLYLDETDTGDVHHKLVTDIPFDPTGQRIQARAIDTGRNRNGLSNIIELDDNFSIPFDEDEEHLSDVSHNLFKLTGDIEYYQYWWEGQDIPSDSCYGHAGEYYYVDEVKDRYTHIVVLVSTGEGKYSIKCRGSGYILTDELSSRSIASGSVNDEDIFTGILC